MKEKKKEKNKRWTPFDLKVSINNKTKETHPTKYKCNSNEEIQNMNHKNLKTEDLNFTYSI